MIENKSAEKIFLDLVIRRGYESAIHSIKSLLKDGPPGREPDNNLVEISQWFSGLNQEQKNMIFRIVEESVMHSTYLLLLILDRAYNYEISQENRVVDFSLELQTYASWDDQFSGKPNERIRINQPSTGQILLHQDFIECLAQLKNGTYIAGSK